MADERFRDLQRQIAKISGSINKLSGEDRTLLLRDFATNYLKEKNANPTLRSSTKRFFENQVINHLVPAFGDLPLDHITNSEWLRWVIETRAGQKITRFFGPRKCLIELLVAARNDGHIEKIPKLDNPDEPKDVGRTLEDREVLKILRNCKTKLFRFFFYVLWKMGCRPREVLQWEWSMFAWNEPGHTWLTVPARISKCDRSRRIPVNPNVSRRLYSQYARGFGSRFVFPRPDDPERPQLSYNGAWGSACRKAGVSAVPYDLRRTFITRCAAEGKPLIYVAKALDTSTKMIESVYAKAQAEVMEAIVR